MKFYKNIINKNLRSYFKGALLPFFILSLFFLATNYKSVNGKMLPGWGVLAINTNKDVYFPNENIHIEYAALDNLGLMDCDAKLSLEIYDQDNNIINKLTTSDNTISVNPNCRQKNNKEPDFESNININYQGEFRLFLTAETDRGIFTNEKIVTVKDKKLFDVEKISATRIYPKDEYEVKIKVTPYKSFSGKIEEIVPSEFDVVESKLFNVEKIDDIYKKIIWNVAWEPYNSYELVYKFKAPQKSPEYFEIGPTTFSNNNLISKLFLKDNIYTLSSHQIAVDALTTRYSTSCSGGWTSPANAQGTPTLASNAAYSSFTTSNSSSTRVSDNQTDLSCTTFDSFDLGQLISANIVFSFATDGAASGDDSITVNYDVGASSYSLVTIIQNAQKSNATNGGYWTYVATNITNFADLNNLIIYFSGDKAGGPDRRNAYVDAVWVDVTYNTRVYTQNDFKWMVTANSATLTNTWPVGLGSDLTENQIFTQLPATNEALDNISNQRIRIQMNFTVGSYGLPSNGNNFKLQYVAANDCTTATGWIDVGAKASATIWRLFDEVSLADSVIQINDISTSNSGAEGYYSEINASAYNPNTVNSSYNTEWDWPVENNGAPDNTTYCFRMVLNNSEVSFGYNADSYPKLTTAPGTSSLMRHGNFFQGDAKNGYFWAN